MKKTFKYFTILDIQFTFFRMYDHLISIENIKRIFSSNGIRKVGENDAGVGVFAEKHWVIAWNLLWAYYRKQFEHVYDVQPMPMPSLPSQSKALWIN